MGVPFAKLYCETVSNFMKSNKSLKVILKELKFL